IQQSSPAMSIPRGRESPGWYPGETMWDVKSETSAEHLCIRPYNSVQARPGRCVHLTGWLKIRTEAKSAYETLCPAHWASIPAGSITDSWCCRCIANDCLVWGARWETRQRLNRTGPGVEYREHCDKEDDARFRFRRRAESVLSRAP